MEAEWATIAEYSRAVEKIIHALNPLLIYLYQEDVERALRAIAAQARRCVGEVPGRLEAASSIQPSTWVGRARRPHWSVKDYNRAGDFLTQREEPQGPFIQPFWGVAVGREAKGQIR